MVDLRYSSADNLYKIDFDSQKTEEKVLLKRLAQGDRDVFWTLWESYQNYLYHRCLAWMGGNHDDAQEVMSLAMVKAWSKLPNHALNITNLKGWLNRFTHNLCVDIHRQRQHSAMGVDNVEDLPLNDHELVVTNCPESELLQEELHRYIRNCIDSLAPRLREPLILSYYQEMSHADISKKLAISPSNVAKRLQSAKQILKKSLDKYRAGLETENITENQPQPLENQDLSDSLNIDSTIEEINYQITISCLETLPPVWSNLHLTQVWI